MEKTYNINILIHNIVPDMINFRRDLHRNPEAGFHEFDTSEKVRNKIKNTPGRVLQPFLETDVTILLEGTGEGPNITLRADMDALKIRESSGKQWASENKDLAHSCGHDGHTSILLGTYIVLSQLTDYFAGSVRFIFQPAEEGLGGGKKLVDKGILKTPPLPEAVFALHGWPGQPLNTIAAGAGPQMAASDRFSITIKGKGGHGALPHTTIDPIAAGSSVVQELQTIISRKTDPLTPAVISVCSFHSGDADNAIPDTAELKGTTRCFDPDYREKLPGLMEDCVSTVCAARGAEYDFVYSFGYIPLINEPEQTAFVKETVEKWLGKDAWHDESSPAMTGEDFAYYLEQVPGTFIRLGMGEKSPGLHNPAFDFNDDAIETGIRFFCGLVLDKLGL